MSNEFQIKTEFKTEPDNDVNNNNYLIGHLPPPDLSQGVDPAPPPRKSVAWKNHSDALKKSILELLHSSQLCDIVLSSADGDVHAHKVILAAQSGYVRNICANDPTVEVISLQDVGTPGILTKMISYLYEGECLLEQNEVDEFKALGASLEIQGFQQDVKPDTKSGKGKGGKGKAPAKRKHSETEEDQVHVITDEDDGSKKMKAEDQGEEQGFKKLDVEYLDLGGGSFSCCYCHKIAKSKHNVEQHIGLIHTGAIKPKKCFHCDYTSKLKVHLKSHCVKKHNMLPQHFDKLAKAYFGK